MCGPNVIAWFIHQTRFVSVWYDRVFIAMGQVAYERAREDVRVMCKVEQLYGKTAFPGSSRQSVILSYVNSGGTTIAPKRPLLVVVDQLTSGDIM